MTVADETAGTTTTMKFNYDASGVPVSFMHNGTTYYYITNLQGDVVGIINQSGAQIVSYAYDAWGNLLSAVGNTSVNANAEKIAKNNPLRYRGYVYDTETGYYYLQSRYYNPEIGRFINADSLIATGQGLLGNNAFAYCLNNPGNYSDQDGKDAIWIQEESNVGGLGHSGLLVQDKNGQWYYFYWGNGTGKEKVTFYLIAVNVEGYDLNNAKDVAEIVDNALSEIDDGSEDFKAFRKKRRRVTSTVYFDGDYSATFTYLDALGQKARNGSVEYILLFRNCGQVCWRAMAKSDERFVMTGCSVIPNMAVLDIRLFSQFTVDEYSDYLRIQNILAE